MMDISVLLLVLPLVQNLVSGLSARSVLISCHSLYATRFVLSHYLPVGKIGLFVVHYCRSCHFK